MTTKEQLAEAIYNYLAYDQKADERWHSPSPKNEEYWNKVKIDSERIADIALEILEKK